MKDKHAVTMIALVAITMLLSCGDKGLTPEDNEAIIAEVFTAGMTGYAEGMSSADCSDCTRGKSRGSIQINEPVDTYVYGPEGGYIHVIGSLTGNMTFDDVTGECLSAFLSLGLTETIVEYTFTTDDDRTFTMHGDPYISFAGTFTLLRGCVTFGTASSISVGGAFQVVGPGFDKTYDINLSIIINSTGTGGHVSGYIGDMSIDYTF